MSRDYYDTEAHEAAVRYDLDRIATALERIADKIAPPPEPPLRRAACNDCTYVAVRPGGAIIEWSEAHEAETGHTVTVGDHEY